MEYVWNDDTHLGLSLISDLSRILRDVMKELFDHGMINGSDWLLLKMVECTLDLSGRGSKVWF